MRCCVVQFAFTGIFEGHISFIFMVKEWAMLCLLHAWLILWPCWWRQYILLKCQWTSAGLHGVTSQKTVIFRPSSQHFNTLFLRIILILLSHYANVFWGSNVPTVICPKMPPVQFYLWTAIFKENLFVFFKPILRDSICGARCLYFLGTGVWTLNMN
jgi:hypothetical protein